MNTGNRQGLRKVAVFIAVFLWLASITIPLQAQEAHGQPPRSKHVIDVLFVYAVAGGVVEPHVLQSVSTTCSQGVNNFNNLMAAQEIPIRVRQVGVETVDYIDEATRRTPPGGSLSEPEQIGSESLDLQRLRNPADGDMDEVHALRDSLGADIVVLVFPGRSHDPIPVSIAYRPTALSPALESYGFGVCKLSFMVGTDLPSYFSYTMGMLLGAGGNGWLPSHQNSQGPVYSWAIGRGLFPYSNSCILDNASRSIMWHTYHGGAMYQAPLGGNAHTLGFFSTPEMLRYIRVSALSGEGFNEIARYNRCGDSHELYPHGNAHAQVHSNGSYRTAPDNSRTFRETAAMVAAYRTPIKTLARAGLNQHVLLPDNTDTADVRLYGSGSVAGVPGLILRHEWFLDNERISQEPDPLITLHRGSHVLRLKVTDHAGHSDMDTIQVTLAQAPAPRADAAGGRLRREMTVPGLYLGNFEYNYKYPHPGLFTLDENLEWPWMEFVNDRSQRPYKAFCGVADLDGSGNSQVILDGSQSMDFANRALNYSWSEAGVLLAQGANPRLSLPYAAFFNVGSRENRLAFLRVSHGVDSSEAESDEEPLVLQVAHVFRVPGEVRTLQAALEVAPVDSIILVAPGVYTGAGNRNLTINKRLTLRSERGPGFTTLDAAGASRVIFISGELSPHTLLEGFTIMGGSASQGGGIFCQTSSPTIRNCILRSNTASLDGGGIFISGGSWAGNVNPVITQCHFSGNSAGRHGGGLCVQGDVRLNNNLFAGNRAGQNGGGIYVRPYVPRIWSHNTLTGNTAAQGGALFWDHISPSSYLGLLVHNTGGPAPWISYLSLANSIIWGNNAPIDPGIGVSSQLYPPSVHHCVVQGGWNRDLEDGLVFYWRPGNEGNISTDPGFVDAAAGDFRLQRGSPAIAGGDPRFGTSPDLLGNSHHAIPDIGAFAFFDGFQVLQCLPPDAVEGWHYSWTFKTIHGAGSLRWEVCEGQLPSGMTLVSEGPQVHLRGRGKQGTYAFTLQARDAQAGMARIKVDALTVHPTLPNLVPTASIKLAQGPNYLNGQARPGATLTVSGLDSTDTDHRPSSLQFEWSADNGIVLDNPQSHSTSFVVPNTPGETYTIRLRVFDGLAWSLVASHALIVNSAPLAHIQASVQFVDGSPPPGHPEAIGGAYHLFLDGSSSQDPDVGHLIGYSWRLYGFLFSSFAIPASIELPQSEPFVWQVTLNIYDGLISSTATVVVRRRHEFGPITLTLVP